MYKFKLCWQMMQVWRAKWGFEFGRDDKNRFVKGDSGFSEIPTWLEDKVIYRCRFPSNQGKKLSRNWFYVCRTYPALRTNPTMPQTSTCSTTMTTTKTLTRRTSTSRMRYNGHWSMTLLFGLNYQKCIGWWRYRIHRFLLFSDLQAVQ